MKPERATRDWLDVSSPLFKAQERLTELNLKPGDKVTWEDRGRDGRLHSFGVRRGLRVEHVYFQEGSVGLRFNAGTTIMTDPFKITAVEQRVGITPAEKSVLRFKRLVELGVQVGTKLQVSSSGGSIAFNFNYKVLAINDDGTFVFRGTLTDKDLIIDILELLGEARVTIDSVKK